MQIKRITLSESEAESLLPEREYGSFLSPGSLIIGGFEEDTLLVMGLFVRPDNWDSGYILEYLSTSNEGDMSVYSSYLKEVETFFKGSTKWLNVRLRGNSPEFFSLHDLLVENDYVPLNMSGRFLRYAALGINLENYTDTSKNSEILKNICSTKSIIPQKKKEFLQRMMAKNPAFSFPKTESEKELSRFYVSKEGIVGFVIANRISDNCIFVTDFYANKGPKGQRAFTALALYLLGIIAGDRGILDIYFQINDSYMYEAVKLIFGEPDDNQLIFEFVKGI